jgi:FKBP-type peptidyl-prolyl cis-trans isomerase
MKKSVIFICLVCLAITVHARAIQEDYKKAEEKARMSYAFGIIIGEQLLTTDLEFDYNAFADGIKAVYENTPQLSRQEAEEIVEQSMQNAIDKKAEANRILESEFLMMNMEKPGIIVTSSGLQYEIIDETDGEKPNNKSIVKVNYEGCFIDGKVFDCSPEEDGVSIPLNRVIPGWTEGIMLMSTGSRYKFYIPSDLAYGKEGIQTMIPPYSTLIFTVELLEIINVDGAELEF